MREDGIVHLIHVGANDVVADITTKPLSAEPFERHVENITGMNNCKANCVERFWIIEAGVEYQNKKVFLPVRYRTITSLSKEKSITRGRFYLSA